MNEIFERGRPWDKKKQSIGLFDHLESNLAESKFLRTAGIFKIRFKFV